MTERKDTTQSGEHVDGRRARQAWTRKQLDRIAALTADQPVPRYGTTDWAGLADTDPRKWAAVLATAEGAARDEDQLPERIEAELDAVRQADDRAATEAFTEAQRISREARKRPRYEDKRAREREAAKPKPGEYRGGPVSWEPDRARAGVPRPREEAHQKATGSNAAEQEEDPVERARRAVTAATSRRRAVERRTPDRNQAEPEAEHGREALPW